eukprot:jgi/Galph1/1706/GphlegSOOS_G376.1
MAENLREQANAAVRAKRYQQACELYSKAIELAPCAILYSNRALTRTKLEEYGYAYMDACKAIELDAKYPKGYYRRAVTSFALGKYKPALEDFKRVLQLVPNDTDALAKKKECEKRIREQSFAKAIDSDAVKPAPLHQTIHVESIIVEDEYEGPKLEEDYISESFCYELVEYLKKQKKLHKKYVVKLLLLSRRYFDTLPNIVSYPVERFITVCGDVHGQFYDLLNIFQLNGYPSHDNPYLFNGDFVDRGSFSVEVILTLLAFACYDSSCMYLNRGNHESRNMNKIYGFEGEVKAKYSEMIYNLFEEVFESLPLGHLLIGKDEYGGKKQVLVIHGGLFSRDGVTLDDLQRIDRHREPDEGLLAELLWSDPQKERGWGVSKRGIGVAFGPDVTARFLDNNEIQLLIRSHEMKEEGYEIEADNRLITVFSAPNYCDQMGNKGAYIRLHSQLKTTFYTFQQVEHPNIPTMAYATNGLGAMGLV